MRPQRRSWLPVVAWLALAVPGVALVAEREVARQRAAFETDARIVHRLLSQRVVQHDAILGSLALLQPTGDAPARLPSLYPQVLRVVTREADQAWPDAALATAESASREARRAVVAGVDLAGGRYWLVQAAAPASHALSIDVDALVSQAEWPLARDGPVQVALARGADRRVLQPGSAAAGLTRFGFAKALASESQPFEVQLARPLGWRELPWLAMGAWAAVAALTVLAVSQWRRQQADRRRSRELLRLGQVGRLNALGELAAGMAHELNQPLTAVLANVQAAERLIGEAEPDLATARHAMAQAAQQARRAGEVVGRLRRVVERPGAELAPLRVAPLLADALDLLAPEFARLGFAPQLSVEPATLSVRADPVALEQIVHNLLSNALHALAQVDAAERQLVLRAAAEGDKVRIEVQDSGPGIAAEVLPRLFEPFFSTRPGGLGLGLSLCETLAVGMGGALAAANAAPRGATFRLELPAAAG